MQNSKKVAILTGATGGLGHAFLKELDFDLFDEIWAVGRNEEKLEVIVKEFGSKIVPYQIDLSKGEELASFADVLSAQHPQIVMLINNAGIAQMKQSKDLTVEELERTIDVNCKAPTILTNMCLPYMTKGSKVLNICSASAFQPVPYLNLYASTKAFERSYSRAMNVELKPLGITVTAVCPGWIDTPLLVRVMNGKKVSFTGIVSPERVAKKALKDAKRGKDMSVCSFPVKYMHANVKFLPQKWTMKIWLRSIRKYIK